MQALGIFNAKKIKILKDMFKASALLIEKGHKVANNNISALFDIIASRN
ncbi:hypothetical protein [Acinetobacter sp. ANC 3813]|nr:hypothetical protein [Acinetobacter sp. ANC 3813]